MSDDPADLPLDIDIDLLSKLAALGERHHNAMLRDVRATFGDERAATLHTILLAMQLGSVLKTIRNAERAPDGVDGVWSLMGVPFTLETKRTQ